MFPDPRFDCENQGRLFYRHAMGKMNRAFLVALLLTQACSFAQAQEREPSAIFELGGAGEWVKGGSSYGPSVAMETTPIENWLELEGGETTLFSRGQTEWDTDLLFKKPWTLSDTTEFMFGVGPEWTHTVSHGVSTDSVSGEAALDFMFWPWPKRAFGLYLEPSYDYSFSESHEQSLSVSAGLLIPIP
jgi:hypothetical protein